jgi:hypothetical protein
MILPSALTLLLHHECPNARQTPDARHLLFKQAVGQPSMTNFERKKNDGTLDGVRVIIVEHWPVY